MYFYELHEGNDEVYSDILLAREELMEADRFFETVQEIRRRIQDTYEQDTLIEAIAEELESDHDFIFISDDRLTAAVNVSAEEGENFIVDLAEDADDDEGSEVDSEDFRSVIADLRVDGGPRPN